jgi:hypothetical protein
MAVAQRLPAFRGRSSERHALDRLEHAQRRDRHPRRGRTV